MGQVFRKSFLASTTLLLLALSLSGCGNMLDRVQRINKAPDFASIENPAEKQGYKPVSWPAPDPQYMGKPNANSLWQPGSKAFFRDQRARREGDILTVKVTIDDKAKLDNKTDRTRKEDQEMGAPNVAGYEGKVLKKLPLGANLTTLLATNSSTTTSGDGKIDRKEQITTNVAAMVTQVLPNGNLVISGKQQVRVNYESREVSIAGVIRPEDIKSNNTIDLAQVAEARVGYGGEGQLSDIQQPRWGAQLIDAISPF